MGFERCACRGTFLDKFIQPSVLILLFEEALTPTEILKKLYKSDVLDYSRLDLTGYYRTLKKMEANGVIESVKENDEKNRGKQKRLYRVTQEGKICLYFWKATLDDYVDKIGRLSSSIPVSDLLAGVSCQHGRPIDKEI